MKKTEIEKYRACEDAVEFRKQFKTFKEAWTACYRGDWMLWIASKVEVDSRKLFLTKGKCAELVIHLMKDERSRKAVQAAIDYGNGDIDESELSASADAAYASAYATDSASYSTDFAALAAYASDALKDTLKKCADICREILTEEVLSKL